MNRAGGAAFALQLHHAGPRAPEIFPAARRPIIRPLAHGRGRSNGINRDNFTQAVGHGSNGFVGVEGSVLNSVVHALLYTGRFKKIWSCWKLRHRRSAESHAAPVPPPIPCPLFGIFCEVTT